MGRADFLKEDDWNADCSMCGHKYKASQLRKHWQGLYRCPSCWEPRHPQDFVKAVKEDPSVPFVQKAGEYFINFCTVEGQLAIPAYAIPSCALPGRANPLPSYPGITTTSTPPGGTSPDVPGYFGPFFDDQGPFL